MRFQGVRWAVPAATFVSGTAAGVWFQRQQAKPQAPDNENAAIKPTTSSPETVAAPPTGPVDMFGAVGNTPLLELKSVSRLTQCKIYAKAEFMNPCGSVKDRAAKYLILDAERKGQLKPGDAVVEATGGNTGISMALLSASRGYSTIFTMPDRTAPEKIELMKVMGASVHVQPQSSMFDKVNHFYFLAHRLHAANSHSAYPNQFENTASMRAHYETTGPEIWRQTSGKIDGFVAASGTAGTISGVSKFLKEVKPDCAVWLVDPDEVAGLANYVNADRSNSEWKDDFEIVPTRNGTTITEGIGLPRVTPNFRHAVVDKGITVTNQEVVDMAYFLLRNDGVFVGPSAALNVAGAVKMARELGPGHTIVTILCDGGDRYRSKLYNREWLKERDLLPTTDAEGNLPSTLDFVKEL